MAGEGREQCKEELQIHKFIISYYVYNQILGYNYVHVLASSPV